MPENETDAAPTQAPAGAAAPKEIEVKLEAPAAALRGAFDLPVFAGAALARARTYETTYFDTEDNALSRAGMALRVRRAGRRRIMTLKWTLEGAEGAFARGEQEAIVHGETPEPFLLGPECAAMVAQATGGSALELRSQTRFRRRTATLVYKGATIEAAQDIGRIVAGDRTSPIAELELELKDGDAAALYELACELTQHGFRVTAAPKGLRGHWLATGEEPKDVRAIAPAVTADSSFDDLIAAILDANLRQFVGNWPALSPARPEAVHQMRVALRRMRSALALFNKAAPCDAFVHFRGEAKRIASAMGPARDQDVLHDLVEHGPAPALGGGKSFDALLKASEKKRLAAYKAVSELIAAPATSRFVLDLQAMIARRDWRGAIAGGETPPLGAPEFAAAALSRLDKRARKRGKNLVELEPEQRHEARIALKNLRYAADFFTPLFEKGKGARKFMRAMGELQDALGAYNDSIVARAIVADIEKVAGAAAMRAAGAVDGWTARGAADADEHLGAVWKAFRKAPRFWQ
jgi:inorganic triphosphatase YgiF